LSRKWEQQKNLLWAAEEVGKAMGTGLQINSGDSVGRIKSAARGNSEAAI